MIYTQISEIEKTSTIKTLFMAILWVYLFVYVHQNLYVQICDLCDRFSDVSLVILRGHYWGILVILFFRSFRQLPNPGIKTSFTIVLFACVIIFAQDVGLHGIAQAQNWLTNRVQPGSTTFWWLVVCYALILAIPFMPGIELGLLLMLMFGEPGILAAYGGTVIGLLIPYLLGRTLPEALLNKFFLKKFASSNSSNSLGNPSNIFNSLINHRFVKRVLKCRAFTLAIAFNLPCNSLIGGGGSIAIAAGAQRFVSLGTYCLIIVLATLPIPLLAYTEIIQIESLFAGQELTQVNHFCPKN